MVYGFDSLATVVRAQITHPAWPWEWIGMMERHWRTRKVSSPSATSRLESVPTWTAMSWSRTRALGITCAMFVKNCSFSFHCRMPVFISFWNLWDLNKFSFQRWDPKVLHGSLQTLLIFALFLSLPFSTILWVGASKDHPFRTRIRTYIFKCSVFTNSTDLSSVLFCVTFSDCISDLDDFCTRVLSAFSDSSGLFVCVRAIINCQTL